MIPITQYTRPPERERAFQIRRPVDIETAAQRFIHAGGNYTCEVLRSGDIRLCAVKQVDGELRDVENIVSANDESVLDALDDLVLLSVAHIKTEESL